MVSYSAFLPQNFAQVQAEISLECLGEIGLAWEEGYLRNLFCIFIGHSFSCLMQCCGAGAGGAEII